MTFQVMSLAELDVSYDVQNVVREGGARVLAPMLTDPCAARVGSAARQRSCARPWFMRTIRWWRNQNRAGRPISTSSNMQMTLNRPSSGSATWHDLKLQRWLGTSAFAQQPQRRLSRSGLSRSGAGSQLPYRLLDRHKHMVLADGFDQARAAGLPLCLLIGQPGESD